LIWHYSEAAAHVTGIDPFEEAIGWANANKPYMLRDQGGKWFGCGASPTVGTLRAAKKESGDGNF
jgi:hypothetical protein